MPQSITVAPVGASAAATFSMVIGEMALQSA